MDRGDRIDEQIEVLTDKLEIDQSNLESIAVHTNRTEVTKMSSNKTESKKVLSSNKTEPKKMMMSNRNECDKIMTSHRTEYDKDNRNVSQSDKNNRNGTQSERNNRNETEKTNAPKKPNFQM